MSNKDLVLYEDLKNGVGLVKLNRPERLNAITPALSAKLKEILDQACADDSIKVIVLTGEGRGFTAGADMDGLASTSEGKSDSSEQSKDDEPWKGFSYVRNLDKPVIAAINGPAAGVGFILSLYCDIRFASETAVFSTAFSKRGLIAEWGVGWMLSRIIGLSHANDLLFSARKFDGKEAERIGLVNKAIPADSFMDEVIAYAEDLAKNVSPRSVKIMKEQMYASLEESFDDHIQKAFKKMVESFGSDDFKEGVKHFIEKRPANFTGK